jgi:phage-related protein
MANTFGGSIKLTGESDYRKALRDITSDMRLMASEMKVMATSTDKSASASDADKAKKEALSKAIADQRSRLQDLNKALADSNAQNGEASDASKKLQIQINNATANLNKMETQLNSTGKETGQLGSEMDGTGKKASIFGDVLKANLASDAIVAGVKAIGSAIKAIGTGVVDMVKDSVKAFADYEQLVGGVETLFKDSSKQVQAYANEAYKTAGLSANAYMETVTGFSASLLQGLGGDTAKASEIANTAVTDMSDNANKMGTDISLIQNAYQGFAKDNFTMLDNLKLGYGGTASEMARLVNDSGVMGSSFKATAENVKDIPFDKLIEAIHKTQTELGITGTTAKEASSTISGSFNSVKASWENVLASFGTGNNEQIQQAIDGLLEGVGNLATNVTAILPSVVEGIGQLAQGLIEQIPTIITTILPTLISAVQGLVGAIVTVLPQLVPVVVQLLTQLVNIIITNLPMLIQAGIDVLLGLITGIAQAIPQLIPQIVIAIETIITTLVQNLPAIILAGIQLLIAIVQGLANALPQLIGYIPQIINTLVTTLTNPTMLRLIIQASIQLIIAVIGGLIQAIPALVQAVPQIISALVNGLKAGVGSLVSVGGDLIRGLWQGIQNVTGWIMDKIKGFGQSVLNGIKGFFGIHSPSTLFRDEIGVNLGLGVGEGFTASMDGVTKDMQKAIPTKFDTSVELNNTGLASKVADSNSLASALNIDNLSKAVVEGFKSVKIELDDQKVGTFVTNTVQGALYG